MPANLVRFTVVFPPALEAQLLEMLLEHDPPLPGFTVLAAEGHGDGFERASVHEQVRGRVARRLLTVVLDDALQDHLLAHLQRSFSTTEISWWVEPISAFGKFA